MATPVNDFSPAISQSITIPEGSSQTAIPVTIVGDTIPELDENLIAILNTVEIIGESVDSSATGPLLGAITETAVVISVNDDPYGKFYLFASNGESEVRVIEAENFGITLIIERRGGTLGDVQVNWDVISGIAEEGEDYAGRFVVVRRGACLWGGRHDCEGGELLSWGGEHACGWWVVIVGRGSMHVRLGHTYKC